MLKKYVSYLVVVALLLTLGLSVFCVTTFTPIAALNKQETAVASLQEVNKLIVNKQYEQAINKIELIEGLDANTMLYHKNKYAELLSEYKKILIEQANSYANNGENHLALNLLNSKLKFYKNDDTIMALINYNQNVLKNKDLVEYNGDIEHLFTHCLLAFPEQALNPKNNMSKNYDKDCITPSEFNKVLTQLYNNNYVLVDIDSVYAIENGVSVKKQLFLPKNKKPLIFSFDDVNYDSKKQNKGMVDKIILDRNNNIATYTSKKSIQDRVSYDNEFITILESFIKLHPDFSFNGARGVICLTGYDGILGYRTQKNNANCKYEAKKAIKLVNKLKSLGWKFACHTYGHYHMNKISDMEFAKEISYWQNEVEPIIGKTNIYVYPYGEWDVVDSSGNITAKHQMLLDAGFKLFCGVGTKTFYNYIPIGTKSTHTLLMDRKPIDGYSLRHRAEDYAHLFNTNTVYDSVNRTIPITSEN